MPHLVCLLFFASGAAALILETLWFRQAGLGLGNTVWASSLVLSSFMAGLCLGSAWVARVGHRIRDPLATYAKLELSIAASGPVLTLVLPALGSVLGPLLGALGDGPLLATARLSLAFLCLLVPATAMGATLPVLTKALCARDPRFGPVLGKLYGWNTLGAVAGALAGELWLTPRFGVLGTAYLAGALGCAAAAGATLLSKRLAEATAPIEAAPQRIPLSARSKRILLAAALCGGCLLALEVVWFRFLLLFMSSTSGGFAIMLAVVLAGIAAGGLLGSALLRFAPRSHEALPAIAATAGLLTIASYAVFSPFVGGTGGYSIALGGTLTLAARLMLPVCIASGLLFTLQGAALYEEFAGTDETRAAGLLTLANTFGGLLGAAAGGFLLLPSGGIEASFFGLACVYIAAALSLWTRRKRSPRARMTLALPVVAAVASVALFPWGALGRKHLPVSGQAYRVVDRSYPVAIAEGANCTVRCLRSDFLGEPLHYRLLSNGYSMSGSLVGARRYMKLYAYLPMAIRPQSKKALLIGFGVGQTAKALTDTKGLEEIHIADPTPEILGMSPVIFPDPKDDPLNDPRIRLHVEDGRFFLQTTSLRFDLITGEPPPPKAAGIVSLYTQDHFQLLHDRLTDGGVVTYWLPGHSLSESDAEAIVKAFGEVFSDFTLWQGWGLSMMLVGTRNDSTPTAPVTEEEFSRQWHDPIVGPELRALGIEHPEQLGALFLADAPTLRKRLAGVKPLTDVWPYRLSPEIIPPHDTWNELRPWLDESLGRQLFEASPWIGARWPAALRTRTLEWFEIQSLMNEAPTLVGGIPALASVQRALDRAGARTIVLWLLGSGEYEQRIVDRVRGRSGVDQPIVDLHLGARAMADRRYAAAAEHYSNVVRDRPQITQARLYQAYAHCLSQQTERARAVLRDARRASEAQGDSWAWLIERFGL